MNSSGEDAVCGGLTGVAFDPVVYARHVKDPDAGECELMG